MWNAGPVSLAIHLKQEQLQRRGLDLKYNYMSRNWTIHKVSYDYYLGVFDPELVWMITIPNSPMRFLIMCH